MLKVRVVCVGKIKETYLKDAVAEYAKRLSGYARLEVVEVAESNPYKSPNAAEIQSILKTEGERIMRALGEDQNVILLCVEGAQRDSLAFAQILERAPMVSDTLTFVIGGSYGLAEEIKRAYPQKLSFSKLTFPHQLMRVILLEQLYRGFKILRNETYHK